MSDTVSCSLCGKLVPVADVCSTEACRECHVSLSFEDCLAGFTGLPDVDAEIRRRRSGEPSSGGDAALLADAVEALERGRRRGGEA